MLALMFMSTTTLTWYRTLPSVSQKMVERHGTTTTFYAHASNRCLHIRPLINLKSVAGVETDETEGCLGESSEFGALAVAVYSGVVVGAGMMAALAVKHLRQRGFFSIESSYHKAWPPSSSSTTASAAPCGA